MKSRNKIIFWTPRILGLLFVLFLMMFSLDVFESGSSVWQIAIGLLVHNIPALILLTVVFVSWRREIVGAIVFPLSALAYITLVVGSGMRDGQFAWYRLSYSLIIAGPAFLVGGLFLVNWIQKKKKGLN